MNAAIDVRRIFLMVVPVAFLLCAVVVVPIVLERWDDRRERLAAVRAEKEALYRVRLVPCNPPFQPTGIEELALRPGEVAVEVFPAFGTPRGFKVSREVLVGYVGAAGVQFLPPPPPPPADSGLEDQADRSVPEYTRFTPVVMPQPLGVDVLEMLKTEIDHADAEPLIGLDGITYVLRHGDRCAMAWSPSAGTRADKIVDLIDALGRLGKGDASQAVALRAEIANRLAQLEADTRELSD